MATNPLFRLIFQSPFKPMQEHMRVVVRCANEVPGLFEVLRDQDKAELETRRRRISDLENQADKIKNELRAHLPRSLFMPVDRRDLLEILDLQDSIADTAQDIAGMLVVRDMEYPTAMQEPLMALTRRCVDACNQLAKIMEELDELLESGFGGRDSERVLQMVDELNRIETDTDGMGLAMLRQLFTHEDEMRPVSVMLWRRVIHWIGDLANYAEKAGNRLRLLVAR